MGGEGDVQIFSIYRFSIYDFNAERTSLIVRVTTDDNTLAVGTLESDGLESVFYRIEGKERAARLYEVGEMLVGVVLGSLPICSIGRAHLHEGVLLPAPSTAALVAEDEVPIVVLVAAAADVLVKQEEGVLTGTPVHLALAALALAAHHVKVGVVLAHIVKVLATFPLEAESRNK